MLLYIKNYALFRHNLQGETWKIFHVAKVVQHKHLMKLLCMCAHALAPSVLFKSDLGTKDFTALVRTEDLQCFAVWEDGSQRLQGHNIVYCFFFCPYSS